MKSIVTAALAVARAGGAADALQNIEAAGFNGVRSRAAGDCAPLVVGSQVVTVNYTAPDYALDLYDQWFDTTSRLYYKKITPQVYLNDVYNYFGDARTQASAQCVVSKLPPPEQRPDAPAGRW